MAGFLAARMRHAPVLVNEKVNLGKTAALLAHSSFVVCGDTGIMHLAAAVGARVYVIFGPCGRYEPISGDVRVITSAMACRPCVVFGADTPGCTAYTCVRSISVDDIRREIG
jgi:ADP-heptose:LPS heptosyltransferase